MVRRVLVVAYIFPPIGGGGVQRVTKFIKYLPQFGWLPSVLTVANPSVPILDVSLEAEIPAEVIVRRARTWEPGYSLKAAVADAGPEIRRSGPGGLAKALARRVFKLFLQPDAQALWRPFAISEGKRLLREVGHHAILATAPPYSNLLVGASLSRATGIPLVLDFRDEWDITSVYFENQRPNLLSRLIQQRMQRRVVRRARAVVATTPASARALEGVCAVAKSRAKVGWIYNGYDPEDFPPPDDVAEERNKRYRLSYVGTLWTLTSATPLVEAVRRLARDKPEVAGHLEIVFAGRRIGQEGQTLEGLKDLPCRLVELPYLDHTKAVKLLYEADGLCALLSDVPTAGRVVPAKIFEYMAVKRAILAIAPPGELWDLLRNYPAAYLVEPKDIAGIAACLEREIERHRAGRPVDFHSWDASPFDRRNQAGQLAKILDAVSRQ
jgi:glycosyltransferase involved in cell wall biosynthesis